MEQENLLIRNFSNRLISQITQQTRSRIILVNTILICTIKCSYTIERLIRTYKNIFGAESYKYSRYNARSPYCLRLDSFRILYVLVHSAHMVCTFMRSRSNTTLIQFHLHHFIRLRVCWESQTITLCSNLRLYYI